MLGKTVPRLWTPPIEGRQLTRETSHGFRVIDFAKRIGIKLRPWQRWLLVHGLELDESLTRYRFRTCLTLVARQNGKTLVKTVLSLWRLYALNSRLVVGTAQDLSQAREVMVEGLLALMDESDYLRQRFDIEVENPKERVGVRHRTLADEYFRLDSARGPRYLIKALNRKAGRGLWGCAELNIDELREQTDFAAWAAVSKIVMAQENSQIWCMSNAGDSSSIVLNQLRSVALAGTDPSLFLAEWSAEDGCALDDRRAWVQANPSLGRGLPEEAIRSALMVDPPNVFRTEVLCQFVDALDPAVDPIAWLACADRQGSMDGQVAMAVDVANDGAHVTAMAASEHDGRVRLKVVGAWDNTVETRRALPDLVALIKPKALGWFPNGPGAALGTATMEKLGGVPIKGTAVSEACMMLADRTAGRAVLQPDDPLLNEHINRTGKIGSRGAWQFRRDAEHTDAAWAAAGALYLALNEPDKPPSRKYLLMPEPS